MFVVYGREGCVYCTKSVELLESKDIDYVYYDIKGANSDKLPYVMGYYQSIDKSPTVPLIELIEGDMSSVVGGYTELVLFLEQDYI